MSYVAKLRRVFEIVALVALARLLALVLSDSLSDQLEFARFVSVLYLPAGVAVVSLLVFGYWAGAGIALSAFIWNVLDNGFNLFDSALFAAARYASSVISLALFYLAGRTWPALDLRQLTLTSVLVFVALHSFVNPIVHHIAFYVQGELVRPTVETLAWMAVGDVLGSIVVFLLGSLAMSGWLWAKRNRAL